MNPKVNTAVRALAPVAIAILALILKDKLTPVLAAAGIVITAALALANVFHVPASVVAVLQDLVELVQAAPAAAQAPKVAMMARAKKLAGVAVVLLGFGTALAGGASLTACHATPSEVQTTIADGAKAGACILAQVLGGITDPGAIGAKCLDAVPALIVDVINDFEAATPAKQAAELGHPVTPVDRSLLDLAKQNAIAAISRAGSGK